MAWGAALAPRPSFWTAYGRHLVLFLLTIITVTLAGGPRLALALLSILLAHEMGHYVACRWYGVAATLPFFIPGPPLWPLPGTFGAVIRIQAPFPHRRALFDIGIAGPLAGFVACLPVLVLGLREAQVVPDDPSAYGLTLSTPLAYRWAKAWVWGDLGAGHTLLLGPIGYAAWFGLLVTALNLFPIGQLDGGHVTYALFGRHAQRFSRLVWWLCVVMIVLVGPSFVLWTVLVRLLGLRHPPTLDDHEPVGRARVVVGLIGLIVFAVCFIPNPFRQSWSDLFEAWAR